MTQINWTTWIMMIFFLSFWKIFLPPPPYVSVYINMPCMIIFVCSICTTNQAKKKIFLILSVQQTTSHLLQNTDKPPSMMLLKKILCTVCKLTSYRPYPPDMQINSFANSSSFPSFEKTTLEQNCCIFSPYFRKEKIFIQFYIKTYCKIPKL